MNNRSASRKPADDGVLLTYVLGSQEIKGVDLFNPTHVADHLSEDISVDAMITATRLMLSKVQAGNLSVQQLTKWVDELAYQRTGLLPTKDMSPALIDEINRLPFKTKSKPKLRAVL